MKKILIVEDEKIQAGMYEKLLINHGFEVTVALDGVSGLTTALETHPDLILLDIRMPEMNGVEVFNKLRADEWGKSAKVIILTNYDAKENVFENKGNGVEEEVKDPSGLPGANEFWSIVKELPTAYLVKADNRPEKVLEKIVNVLEFDKEGN